MKIRVHATDWVASLLHSLTGRLAFVLAGAAFAALVVWLAGWAVGGLNGRTFCSLAFVTFPLAWGIVVGSLRYRGPEVQEAFLLFWLGNAVTFPLAAYIGEYHLRRESPATFALGGAVVFLLMSAFSWKVMSELVKRTTHHRAWR